MTFDELPTLTCFKTHQFGYLAYSQDSVIKRETAIAEVLTEIDMQLSVEFDIYKSSSAIVRLNNLIKELKGEK